MPRHFYRDGRRAFTIPLRLFLGLFLLALGSGCVTNVQLGDPPELFLELGSPPAYGKNYCEKWSGSNSL